MVIQNKQGQIALKRLRQIPKLIRVGGGREYVFVVQHNVSLAWIEERDVPEVLRMKRDCCGGSGKPQFVYATEADVRIWTGESER